MSGQIVRLSPDEVWNLLDEVDPVRVVLDELAHGVRVIPPAAQGCVLSAGNLRAVRTAALAALAARHLTASRVVTAAVLGWDLAAELQLSVLVRCVPDITHVAVCADPGTTTGPRIRDQLDLAGIGLSVTDQLPDAIRGANLVHVLDPALAARRLTPLAKGAVIVNGAGATLSADVDQVYVDRSDRLPSRYRMATGDAVAPRRAGPNRPHPVEATLGDVVGGTHPGRTRVDDVLLIELLGADALSGALADQFHRAAVRRGVGVL
jgi:ornithine cyclodeaminase/alanine dehydrogenase-like protein (mu-crystallin family)